jgi:hypothetical protein
MYNGTLAADPDWDNVVICGKKLRALCCHMVCPSRIADETSRQN